MRLQIDMGIVSVATLSMITRQCCGYLLNRTLHLAFAPGKPSHPVNSFKQATAHQLVDEMPDPNVESATTWIGRLANNGRHREAIFHFSRMFLLGDIVPNEYTLGTVIHSSVLLKDLDLGRQIHSHATKINLSCNVFVGSAILDLYDKLSNFSDALTAFQDIKDPNVVSYTTLIRVYMKEGRLNEARMVFRSMPRRNVVSWNTMISGYSQFGENEQALTSFIEMLREGVIPSQSSYPCAVVCAANLGALGTGRSIHASAIKFLGELGLFLSSSLVSFYAKCGVMEDGLLMFMNMKEKNIVSWNACICGHAQNGQGKEAIQVYRMMREGGIEPNSVTLLGLLTAISHAGLVEDGYRYFNEARQKGTSLLTAEHYACMIDLLSRSGRFREAEMFIHDLPFDPGVGFWKALLGGCQVHSNTKLGEAAIRKILDLNPGDISSYVMLSNALSAAGRWENVVDIRGMMKNKGLTRVPGNSWIEIKSKVHVFVTGDRNHSNMHEIHTLIGFHIQHAVDYEVAIDDVA